MTRAFVVLGHGITGPGNGRPTGVAYSRGDVFFAPDAGVNETIDAGISRLLYEISPPAIRPATEAETTQTKVTLPEMLVAKSIEQQLADKDKLIADLRDQLGIANEKVATLLRELGWKAVSEAEESDRKRSAQMMADAKKALLGVKQGETEGEFSKTPTKDELDAARALAQEAARSEEVSAMLIPPEMPGAKALSDASYTTVGQLMKLSEAELTDIQGIGVATAAKIKAFVESLLKPPIPIAPNPNV